MSEGTTGRPPAAVLAETAPLTEKQRAFRRKAGGRLDFALPLGLWRDHHYGVAPGERRRPLATRSRWENWYCFTQVVARGVRLTRKRRKTSRP